MDHSRNRQEVFGQGRSALLILLALIAVLDVILPRAQWDTDSANQAPNKQSTSRNELPRSQALEKIAIMPSTSEKTRAAALFSQQQALVSAQPILEHKTATILGGKGGSLESILKLNAESVRRRAEERDVKKVRRLAEAEAAAAILAASGAAGAPPREEKLSEGSSYVSPAAEGAQGARAFHDLVLKHAGDQLCMLIWRAASMQAKKRARAHTRTSTHTVRCHGCSCDSLVLSGPPRC